MRLYISNFDLAPLAKAMGAGALLITIVWSILPSNFVFDEIPIGSIETFNELILEQYTYEHFQKSIVLVGSSIQTMIPPYNCRPEHVASIYLQGLSAMSGLEAIVRVGARPEVIFVETATLRFGFDQHLIDVVFQPIYSQVRNLIPPLRFNRNWFVLLNRKIIYDDPNPEFHPHSTLYLPPQSLEQWDKEVVLPRLSPLLHDTNDWSVRITVDQLVSYVRTLQQRGTRVIMYNPVDPQLTEYSPMKERKEAIRAGLPDVEYIDPPDDKLPIYRFDGEHLMGASGVLLFNYLMERAGLPDRATCEIRTAQPRQ
jgi:hypothetical protein